MLKDNESDLSAAPKGKTVQYKDKLLPKKLGDFCICLCIVPVQLQSQPVSCTDPTEMPALTQPG